LNNYFNPINLIFLYIKYVLDGHMNYQKYRLSKKNNNNIIELKYLSILSKY